MVPDLAILTRLMLENRGFLEKRQAENLQDFAEAAFDSGFFPDDGHEHVNADRDPHLSSYRVVARSVKGFDMQILFDPFEEYSGPLKLNSSGCYTDRTSLIHPKVCHDRQAQAAFRRLQGLKSPWRPPGRPRPSPNWRRRSRSVPSRSVSVRNNSLRASNLFSETDAAATATRTQPSSPNFTSGSAGSTWKLSGSKKSVARGA